MKIYKRFHCIISDRVGTDLRVYPVGFTKTDTFKKLMDMWYKYRIDKVFNS